MLLSDNMGSVAVILRPVESQCEICALLGYYAAYGGNSLPTFRDNLSGWLLYPLGFPETSLRDYLNTLSNIPRECRSLLFRGRGLNSRNFRCVGFWI
jgi:hypothetical protein